MARTAAQTKDVPQETGPRFSRGTIIGSVIAVVVIAAIVALEVSTQGYEEGGLPQYQEVSVTGSLLPPLVNPGEGDTAVGLEAPVLEGLDWNANALSTAPNGDPSLVMFITHWCPHCQADVPVVQDIIDSGDAPADLNLYAVATSTDETRPNYPPTRWLEGEGWTVPTMLDDRTNTAGASFGLTAYPYWVVLDGAGNVVTRLSGELGRDAILNVMNQAAGVEPLGPVEGGESSSADE